MAAGRSRKDRPSFDRRCSRLAAAAPGAVTGTVASRLRRTTTVMPLQHCDGIARFIVGADRSAQRAELHRLPVGFTGPGTLEMAASLLELMEDLLQSIEERDAADPDAPAWEACARIERLERELAMRLQEGEVTPDTVSPAVDQGRRTGEALAGV
jgi:hypothetical protein